jgi:mannose-1-phosphate guanylyltransferase/mannose-6-phosphate isomerase
MIDKYTVHKDDTLWDAIAKIDANHKGFVVVVDDSLAVSGTITDGDIRRQILAGTSHKVPVHQIFDGDFVFVEKNDSFGVIAEKFKSEKIEFLPVLGSSKKLINILTKKQFHLMLLNDFPFDLSVDHSYLDSKILEHEIYNRPWGFYKSTILTEHAQAKVITVFPMSALSLQEHKKREEHWVVIKGSGKMILGESELDIYPGKYIYIPKGCKHKVTNTSEIESLIFSEVQLGEYFGEDDIIRYEEYMRDGKG